MLDILDRTGMAKCKSCSKLVNTNPKVAATDILAGALQYLTFTRPDIAYVVQQVCLHIHDPVGCPEADSALCSRHSSPRPSCCDRLLRLILSSTPTLIGMVAQTFASRLSTLTNLVVYTDANWVGRPDTRKSTSGHAPTPCARTRCQDLALKPSIARWPTELQRPARHTSVFRQHQCRLHDLLSGSTLANQAH